MRDEQIKELISAYIDDELSVDERVLIERHLADSVESQQFLDQLRRQRVALRSLPRMTLKDDFSQRVLNAIEKARPTTDPSVIPEPSVAGVAPVSRLAPVSKLMQWKSWQSISIVLTTVAATLLIALYFSRPSGSGTGPTTNNLVGKDKVAPVEPRSPDDVRPPEESGLPKELGPEEPLSGDALLALGEFKKIFQYVLVFDVTLTPRAQQKRLFESWMEKAGIPINKGIPIDARLERSILAARFIQDAKIAPGAQDKQPEDEVEMLFVRGTGKHINGIGSPYFNSGIRAGANPEIIMKMDMVDAPKEMYIFLELNKATGLDVAGIKANPAALRLPTAFPLQFRHSIQSVAAARLDATVAMASVSDSDSLPVSGGQNSGGQLRAGECGDDWTLALADADTLLVAQVPEAAEAKPQPQDAESLGFDEPSQAIVIIRRLKEEPKANAAK